jgi:DNA-binding NtrC family response regulator
MVGDSPAFRQALFLLRRFKKTNLPLLIQGETGTGKDLAARYVHRWGPRKAGQFIEVSSGNLPTELAESELFGHKRGAFTGATSDRKGAFEVAHGGTLLLNEIGDMPLEIQVKLLRAIQDGVIQRLGETRDIHVDVRVIAATWRDLPAMVANGEFRGDLYHRLAVGQVELPSLEDRGHDAILIARVLLAIAPEKHGLPRRSLSREAADVLLAYPWPGNVRELQHVLLRALATGSGRSLSISDVQQAITQIAGDWEMDSKSGESRSLVEILERTSPMRAADLRAALGVSRSTLSRVLKPLIESGQILREGTGVTTRYRLADSVAAIPMPDPRWSIAVDLALEKECVTRRELASALGISERTSTRILRAMVEAGMLCERGQGCGVEYVLVAEESERAPR